MFFAHLTDRKDRSDWQTLPDHLMAVAGLAAERGSKFSARRAAALAGILHDLGKYSAAFQRRLDGSGEAVDHSTAGAKHVGRLVVGGADRGMAELARRRRGDARDPGGPDRSAGRPRHCAVAPLRGHVREGGRSAIPGRRADGLHPGLSHGRAGRRGDPGSRWTNPPAPGRSARGSPRAFASRDHCRLGRTLERFPIELTLLVSLPGLTGQSSTHGRCLLDRPVKPGDDTTIPEQNSEHADA
jgi:hypothetical protein